MPFVYKDWEDLTIRDDFMFKAVMKNAELCKSVLEAILSQPIRDIRYLGEELSLKAGSMSKGVRLDVYVEDEAHTVYDVEMQVRQEADDVLPKRMRYYQAQMDVELLTRGRTIPNCRRRSSFSFVRSIPAGAGGICTGSKIPAGAMRRCALEMRPSRSISIRMERASISRRSSRRSWTT